MLAYRAYAVFAVVKGAAYNAYGVFFFRGYYLQETRTFYVNNGIACLVVVYNGLGFACFFVRFARTLFIRFIFFYSAVRHFYMQNKPFHIALVRKVPFCIAVRIVFGVINRLGRYDDTRPRAIEKSVCLRQEKGENKKNFGYVKRYTLYIQFVGAGIYVENDQYDRKSADEPFQYDFSVVDF